MNSFNLPSEREATTSQSGNPFLAFSGGKPFVALKGSRSGYIMLAPRAKIEQYADLPTEIWSAAQAWATTLEQAGSPRVYTIILSEVTRHLHIHLFPRWSKDTLQGTALFDTRDSHPQPSWTATLDSALAEWATAYQVSLN